MLMRRYAFSLLVVAGGVVVPLLYLVVRAFEADAETLETLVFRERNLRLLLNTLALSAGVLVYATVLATPLAWLAARSDLRGLRFVTLVGVLPLALPGYVTAYALLGATGTTGMLSLMGVEVPRLSGYTGALLALGGYTFPYLFLNLRSALAGLDAGLEETARSLGMSTREVLWRVVVPQLRPAYLAGSLLVLLHVLGDFGVVSLMRFETFSYSIYTQYTSAYDRVYAAWLALMLLALTGGVLWGEARLLRGLVLHRAGAIGVRRLAPVPLGRWRPLAVGYAALVALGTLVLPLTTILFWLARWTGETTAFWKSLSQSIQVSLPAALLATLLALPLAYLGVRHPSWMSRGLERTAYLGYATPPLAFALAYVFFSLQVFPGLYQTLLLLVGVYALHYLAESIGPIRTALYQAPPRLEEAARTLGRSPLRAFLEATFPLLRRGLLVSTAFVFLSAMKELPLTFILAPAGFRTLAVRTWSFANEALFGQAAPFALAIVFVSAGFVVLLLATEGPGLFRRNKKRLAASLPTLSEAEA